MTMKLASPSIAILVANGFEESHITAIQRAMTAAELSYKLIAPEQGLVNGWQDNGWGHYFTVDEDISTAMGSDYDCLVLVGGERGVGKLKENLHTRRIVNHFMQAAKPVAAIESGVELLALSPKSAGLEVSVVDASKAAAEAAQMVAVDAEQNADGVVLTSQGKDIDSWVEATLASFSAYMESVEAEEEQAA